MAFYWGHQCSWTPRPAPLSQQHAGLQNACFFTAIESNQAQSRQGLYLSSLAPTTCIRIIAQYSDCEAVLLLAVNRTALE